MFEKILFPTDFSDVSLHTLYNCTPEFSKMGAKEIVIIHILSRAVSIQIEQEEAIKNLKEIIDKLREKDVNARYIVEPLGQIGRNTAEIVSKKAYTEGFDLVVITTKDMNILRRLVSVSRNVIRTCEVPILLLKHQSDDKEKEPKTKNDYGHIFDIPLISLDFSTCSERALDAFKMREELVKEAILYHVVDYGNTEDLEDNIKEAEYILDKYAKTLSISVKNKVGKGEPSESITKAAQDMEASLIVVNKSRSSMFRQIILGNTTNSVVRKSDKPVMVIPCHELWKPE